MGIKTKIPLNDIGACAQQTLVDVDVDPDILEFYLGSKYSSGGGYAWIFPRSKNEANVGIGVPASSKDRALDALKRFIDSKFPGSHSLRMVTGCVPRCLPPSPLVKGRVVLIGDAARLVNPFSGGGIANAFISGRVAGEMTGDMVVNGKPTDILLSYETEIRSRLEKNLRKSYRYKDIFIMNDRRIEMLCTFLKLAPSFLILRMAKGLHY
jgi:digeranylgeranylglycerophospholipid reductase